MRTVRVGLTGGLASGKSTVARWLAEAGFRVVDADRLVAELYEPGGTGAAAVARLFGGEMLTSAGAVDRARLAELVFRDATARAALEAAVHPLVRGRFAEIADAAPGVTVLEATLLVEAGYGPMFDLVVSVEAPAPLRLERARERGLSAGQAAARLEAQGDGGSRRAGADRLLDNSGDLAALRRQVDTLIAELHQRAAG